MAGVRNSAGVNKGGKGASFVNPLYKAVKSVTSYAGNVAREIRDIPTAIGTGSARETARQIKEAAAAATTGQKGTGVSHRQASGDFTYGGRRDGRSA
jgi:hypothetical protein